MYFIHCLMIVSFQHDAGTVCIILPFCRSFVHFALIYAAIIGFIIFHA